MSSTSAKSRDADLQPGRRANLARHRRGHAQRLVLESNLSTPERLLHSNAFTCAWRRQRKESPERESGLSRHKYQGCGSRRVQFGGPKPLYYLSGKTGVALKTKRCSRFASRRSSVFEPVSFSLSMMSWITPQ